jgi:predicted nicotinamide N-methyase
VNFKQMTEKDKPAESAELTQLLAGYVPGGRAVETELPECKGLKLFLLNADYPQHELTSEQMLGILNYPAYWAFCWASGVVMARYLLENPEWVRGKRVLDFGSGSGVAGIAALKAGAERVLACDIDEDAQVSTRVNASLNEVVMDIRSDFNDIEDDIDIILVADVLYDRENLPWLAQFLERAPRVLVADSRVRNFNFPGYSKLAEYESSTLPDLDEFDEFCHVSLYEGLSAEPR